MMLLDQIHNLSKINLRPIIPKDENLCSYLPHQANIFFMTFLPGNKGKCANIITEIHVF